MKNLISTLILAVVVFFSFSAGAETVKQKGLHNMHMIMRFMDHGLCSALEGADLQMLGQMGMSEKLTRTPLYTLS
jgi:hypothetical protein